MLTHVFSSPAWRLLSTDSHRTPRQNVETHLESCPCGDLIRGIAGEGLGHGLEAALREVE